MPAIAEVKEKRAPADTVSSLQSLLATVVIAVFVITFIVQAFQIPSESMENTLLIGDYLLVDKLRYGGGSFSDLFMPYRQVQRGDVIVFRYPMHPTQHFVKRVVGVPGDRVRLINRQVYVNGHPLQEPYVRYSSGMHDTFRDEFPRLNLPVPGLEGGWWLEMKKLVEDDELIIPQGNYFVLGDNRDESLDSRYWGFVPQENVIGRPLLIYWSVRNADQDMPVSPTPGDKLIHFAYAATHVVPNDPMGPHFSSGSIERNSLGARKTQCPRKKKKTQPEEKPRETTVEFLASLAAVLVTGLFIITFVLQAFEIPSSSMENTLLIGDHVFVNRVQFAPATRWTGPAASLPRHTASGHRGLSFAGGTGPLRGQAGHWNSRRSNSSPQWRGISQRREAG